MQNVLLEAAAEQMSSGLIGQLILYVVVFGGIFYLLIILPQKRREKKANNMRDAIATGDEVVTIGGISGKVANIKDDEITIESGIEKTKIKFKKWAIRDVIKPISDKD